MVDPRARDVAGQIFKRAWFQRQAQDARCVDGARKPHAAGRDASEACAAIIRLVADKQDRRVIRRARLLDAMFHQRDPNAASALIGSHGQRAEQQRILSTNLDGPEPHRTKRCAVFDRDETQPLLRLHAFTQTIS